MRIRNAARIILLDSDNRVLLFQYEVAGLVNPLRAENGAFWVTPGGGLEAGETFEAAARRELWEETGLRVPIGTLFYTQEVDLIFRGVPQRDHAQYYPAFTPSSDISFADPQMQEIVDYRDHRWWTLDELRTTAETVFPEVLPDLVERLISDRLGR